ncbi:WXG100 family type VII secretion target [Williamsia sterculiae]|uniref:WXG100 family type VII secretion target n=1 Tax=Williamsia sterculiae TaxID=1344003 RepID=UPI001F26B121|nr:WXG100 family type VII secretion target [Williamsia sterculiae]
MGSDRDDMTVDLGDLSTAAQRVHGTRSQISDDWEKIRDRARSLFEGSWTGTASKSYTRPWSECEEGFQEILSSLEHLGRALHESGAQFRSSDTNSADDIQGSATTSYLNLDV